MAAVLVKQEVLDICSMKHVQLECDPASGPASRPSGSRYGLRICMDMAGCAEGGIADAVAVEFYESSL